MMDDLDKLPSDLVWQQDGHLGDIVLSSVADGEVNIVPHEALSHLEQCDHCTTRFGAEALLSKHAGELLADVSRSESAPARVKRSRATAPVPEVGWATLPKGAVFGALALAAMGAMPALVVGGHLRIAEMTEILGRSILMLSRGVVLVARSDSFTALVWASSMILLISGLLVSRMSRPGLGDGLTQEGNV